MEEQNSIVNTLNIELRKEIDIMKKTSVENKNKLNHLVNTLNNIIMKENNTVVKASKINN